MMICRCPQCGTPFRVTPEQLKVRNGLVRCGECKGVFNALDHLIEEKPARPATTPLANVTATLGRRDALPGSDDPRDVASRLVADAGPRAAGAAAEPAKGAAAASTAAPTGKRPAAPPNPFAVTSGEAPAEAPAADNTSPAGASDAPPPETPFSEETAPAAAIDETPPGTPDTTLGETAQAELPAAPAEDTAAPQQEALAAGLIAPREVRAAPGYSRWAETTLSASGGPLFAAPPRSFRPVYLLLGLALALLLAAQVVYHFRTEIATRWPASRPLLEAVCAPLKCTVPLPRLADLVSIEASDLHADPERENLLVLQASLRNRADFAQDYPALELTLTNVEDKAIARRVLQPGDYLPPGTLSKGGTAFAANAEIELRIWLDPKDQGAAGYRLFLFYP